MGESELRAAIDKAKQLLFEDPEVKEKYEDLTNIAGWKDFLNTFPLLWFLIKRIVYAVELVEVQYKLTTKDEKINVAAQLLDDLITFGGWLAIFEPFDNMLFKLIISAAVQALNDWWGHDWASHPMSDLK